MKVLFVASEALPFMASGGLGDVAGSLPVGLRKRLIGCRVVMPLYDSIPQELKDQMQFITSIRITNSQMLLETTNYAVNEIAHIVGYDNPLYFSRLFHKQKGCSPSEYRKLLK